MHAQNDNPDFGEAGHFRASHAYDLAAVLATLAGLALGGVALIAASGLFAAIGMAAALALFSAAFLILLRRFAAALSLAPHAVLFGAFPFGGRHTIPYASIVSVRLAKARAADLAGERLVLALAPGGQMVTGRLARAQDALHVLELMAARAGQAGHGQAMREAGPAGSQAGGQISV